MLNRVKSWINIELLLLENNTAFRFTNIIYKNASYQNIIIWEIEKYNIYQ